MWWVITGTVVASDIRGPAVCEATWQGPHDPCYLHDSVAVSHGGPSEKKARKLVESRLQEVLGALAASSDIGVAGPALVDQCEVSAVEDLDITCDSADIELRDQHLCFVDLPRAVCGEKPIVNGKMVAWEAWSRGVSKLCGQLDQAVAVADSSDDTRAECRAECLETARVRCVQ